MSRPSRVPTSWGEDSWFMGNQERFKEHATSDALPRWLRVTFAAYGHVAANGHATFRQQELAALLGDQVDGAWTPAPRQRVREAIDAAIDRGLLEPGSKALCLVVPKSAIAFGKGNPGAPCKRHQKAKKNDKTVSLGVETTGFDRVVSESKERSKRVVSRSAPLFSLVTPPPANGRSTS